MRPAVRRTVSLLLTTLVLVVAPVVRADADRSIPAPPKPFSFMQARSTANYGSGAITPWSSMQHGTVGDLASADVLLVGDSITTASWTYLRNRLSAKGATLAVNYWSGRPTTPAVDWVLAQPSLPPIVVMAVGSNDIFNPTVMAAQVARLRAGVPSSVTVLWVDVQVARTGQAASVQLADQRNSGWVNNSIREKCTAPCVVVPWSWWLASSPSRLSMYLSDGVHPKAGSGQDFWAAVLMTKIGPLL